MDLARQEAELLEDLNRSGHPNVPWFQDAFVTNQVVLVMEYIRGQTWFDRLGAASRGLPPAQVVPQALQLASALACLHRRRPAPVIYRDLKPQNVMVDTNGVVKLIDFGIARRHKGWKAEDTSRWGTVEYAAPELLGREPGETASDTDVYSLGATLLHMLTGRQPQALTTPAPGSIQAANPLVSSALEAVVIRAMAQERAARTPTMAAVTDEL
jgi:serine/threonine protein kinase